jgi:hypothetical protein
LGSRAHVLYNDAYVSFLGPGKHPRFLGRPGRECWSEIWDTIGPMLEGVRYSGKATWSKDLQMFFSRALKLEEVFVRFTFGPILGPDGRSVDGIFCPCTETTEQVVLARGLETLRRLASAPVGDANGRKPRAWPWPTSSRTTPTTSRSPRSTAWTTRRRKPRSSATARVEPGSAASPFLGAA